MKNIKEQRLRWMMIQKLAKEMVFALDGDADLREMQLWQRDALLLLKRHVGAMEF